MRKGIAFNTTRGPKFSINLGIVIVFAGMVSLAGTKVLLGSKFGDVGALVSILAGVLLLTVGLAICTRNEKS
jgi:hypothetical protein